MVESAERPKNPLLDRVEKRLKDKEEVPKLLPEFKARVAYLIATKLPSPEIVVKTVTAGNFFEDYEKELARARHWGSSRVIELNTTLEASLPVEGGKALVTISSSDYPKSHYPKPEEGDPEEELDSVAYKIDVEELDSVLIIEGTSVKVESKKWEDVPLSSWPSWSRDATIEDLQGYQLLLDSLDQEGVTFQGSTPPLIIKDYTEIRSQIELPDTR